MERVYMVSTDQVGSVDLWAFVSTFRSHVYKLPILISVNYAKGELPMFINSTEQSVVDERVSEAGLGVELCLRPASSKDSSNPSHSSIYVNNTCITFPLRAHIYTVSTSYSLSLSAPCVSKPPSHQSPPRSQYCPLRNVDVHDHPSHSTHITHERKECRRRRSYGRPQARRIPERAYAYLVRGEASHKCGDGSSETAEEG